MPPDPIRVAVISTNDVIRSGLQQLLGTDRVRRSIVPSMGRRSDLDGVDVAVFDLTSATDGDRDDLVHLIASKTPVVAIQPYSRSDLGEDARLSGVTELVGLDVSAADLVAAVERAAAGRSRTIEGRRASYRTELQDAVGLTDREMDMLELVASGLTNDAIARSLFLSINSVKSYIRTAYAKIGATSRSQAVLWAIEHGLAHPERAGEPSGD